MRQEARAACSAAARSATGVPAPAGNERFTFGAHAAIANSAIAVDATRARRVRSGLASTRTGDLRFDDGGVDGLAVAGEGALPGSDRAAAVFQRVQHVAQVILNHRVRLRE